jgi:methylated-DNA-[protein]-cysteine S-methyltransferase
VKLISWDEELKPYIKELIEYFGGTSQKFTIPVNLYGSPFQRSVWNVLNKIPYGRTYSYSDIASHIGKLDAVRTVGVAIGANPILIIIPCHRIIGKNGSLTGYRGGLELKKTLLDLEKQTN